MVGDTYDTGRALDYSRDRHRRLSEGDEGKQKTRMREAMNFVLLLSETMDERKLRATRPRLGNWGILHHTGFRPFPCVSANTVAHVRTPGRRIEIWTESRNCSSLSLTKQILSPSPHSYIKIMLSARISAARRVPAFARLARFYSEGDVARSKEFSCVFFSSTVFFVLVGP